MIYKTEPKIYQIRERALEIMEREPETSPRHIRAEAVLATLTWLLREEDYDPIERLEEELEESLYGQPEEIAAAYNKLNRERPVLVQTMERAAHKFTSALDLAAFITNKGDNIETANMIRLAAAHVKMRENYNGRLPAGTVVKAGG